MNEFNPTKDALDKLLKVKADATGFSEDALALLFADRHGAGLRYVALWGKWIAWTGTHWLTEKTLAVFDMSRKICRDAASQSNKASVSHALTKAKTVSAVEVLARSDRRIAATVEQWDGDEFSFNQPKTGTRYVHRP
jgi:putative DNA primase/helicase